MKIVAITACIAGIAHTYIAKEKLEAAAMELGDEIKVETQGSIGVENALTKADIDAADAVIIAADIGVSKERFKGKPVVEVPIKIVMKSSTGLIKKVHEKLEKE